EERQSNDIGPFQDAPFVTLLGFLANEFTDAEGLADIVDENRGANDESNTGIYCGAHTNGDALDQLLGTRCAGKDRYLAAMRLVAPMERSDEADLVGFTTGHATTVHEEIETINKGKS